MQIALTIDLTKGKKAAWAEIETFFDKWDTEAAAPTKKTRAKKAAEPEETVSEDEEETFGEKEIDEEELEASDDSDGEGDSDDEEESGLDWDEVKDAINTYGGKKPDDMKAILLSFNMKSTKELQQHKAKWEPVYRKIKARQKALKKSK